MRLKIILLLFMLIIVTVILSNASIKNFGFVSIDYEFLYERQFNVGFVKESRGIREDSLYISFEAVSNQSDLNFSAKSAEFDSPNDFDFDTYNLIISYGREIISLGREPAHSMNIYGANLVHYCVTFGNEYFDGIAFFYRTHKDSRLNFVHTAYGYLGYMLQDDGEKYRINLGKINVPIMTEGERVEAYNRERRERIEAEREE